MTKKSSCLSSCSYIKPQLAIKCTRSAKVVYHLVPTSNHNLNHSTIIGGEVVYHLVPTSNHNYLVARWAVTLLFIILFLHQTTTPSGSLRPRRSCLSSCSYIKPQPRKVFSSRQMSCLSSCSYIKPQPTAKHTVFYAGCLSSCSYIKPQHTCAQ